MCMWIQDEGEYQEEKASVYVCVVATIGRGRRSPASSSSLVSVRCLSLCSGFSAALSQLPGLTGCGDKHINRREQAVHPLLTRSPSTLRKQLRGQPAETALTLASRSGCACFGAPWA